MRAVAFSPDGKTLATGGKDRIIRFWETATGRELRRLEGHRNWVQHLAFRSDGKTLTSWGTGQTLRLWDVATGRQLRQIDLPPWAGTTLAFSPDGQLLAYRGRRSIELLDGATGKELRRITLLKDWTANLAFSADGKLLAGAFKYDTIHLWDTTTGKEKSRPLGECDDTLSGVLFAPDGRSVASVSDRTIRVWEVLTRRERCRFHCPDKNPSTYAFAFAPDGRTLAQGSDDATVLLWDLTGHQEKGHLPMIRLSPKELQALWADLAGADAAAAYRAIWTLAAGASESVPFLQEHLRPVAPVDTGTISRLVSDLDSEQFQTRKEATERLEKFGDLAEPVLRKRCNRKHRWRHASGSNGCWNRWPQSARILPPTDCACCARWKHWSAWTPRPHGKRWNNMPKGRRGRNSPNRQKPRWNA